MLEPEPQRVIVRVLEVGVGLALEGGDLVREAEARTREALVEAMSRALWAVTARDTHGFFDHRGYRKLGQLL